MEKELPSGWLKSSVLDFMTEVKDKVNPDEIENTEYVGLEHIGSGKGIIATGDSKDVRSLKTAFRSGDVLYGKLRPYLNKHDLVNFDGICSTDILVYRNRSIDSSKYFNYFLGLPATISQAHDESSGINLPRVSGKKIAQFGIPVPPLPEQKRIVVKLDALFGHLDNLKSKLDRIPTLLKNFRQQVLTQAVTGKLTEEWRVGKDLGEWDEFLKSELGERKNYWIEEQREIYKSKGKDFSIGKVDKKYKEPIEPKELSFSVPKGWGKCTWDQLSNWITYGFTKPMPSIENGIPKVTVKHVKEGKIDFESTDKTSYEAFETLNPKDKPQMGDILITKDGATLGRSAVVETDREFCIGQSVAVVWLRSTSCNPRFLNFLIQSEYIQRRIWEVARGMGMPHLSITDFRSLTVAIPSPKEQNQILLMLKELFGLADRIESQYHTLKGKIDNLPQAILNKAFKGELVAQDPNDEPASVLLERIKGEIENIASKGNRKKSKDK